MSDDDNDDDDDVFYSTFGALVPSHHIRGEAQPM